MKKSNNNIYSVAGISKVFSFTLIQTFKNPTYRRSFIIFAVMMMLMGPINYLSTSAGMNAAESGEALYDEMDLDRIYFVNDTYVPFSSENAELKGTGFAEAELTDAEEVPGALADNEIAVVIERQSDDDGVVSYVINAIVSDQSSITGSELDALCEHLTERFVQARRNMANLGDAEMTILQKKLEQGSAIRYEEYEAKLNATYTDTQFSAYNMLYSVILMLLIALTGSYVVSSVMEEKTSKLAENLLVSVRPLALIMGKILAMMCFVFSMIAVGAAGSYISNTIIASVVGDSVAMQAGSMLNFSKMFTFAGAKGLLLLPCMILTYFMYSVLAGLLGSACTKLEDSSSAIGTVTMINMISYILGAILPNMGNETALTVVSIIPFISSSIMPVAFICGKIPVWVFMLGSALQILVCIILFMICAKTYRKLLVNDSKKLGLFEIVKLALAKEGV